MSRWVPVTCPFLENAQGSIHFNHNLLVHTKLTKIVATRNVSPVQNIPRYVSGRGSYSAGFKRPLSSGEGGQNGDGGRERRGRWEKKKEETGGGWRGKKERGGEWRGKEAGRLCLPPLAARIAAGANVCDKETGLDWKSYLTHGLTHGARILNLPSDWSDFDLLTL